MLLNLSLVALFLGTFVHVDFDFCCQPVDFSSPEDRRRHNFLILLAYCYLLAKFLDFADTAFFVLRKKNNLVSDS